MPSERYGYRSNLGWDSRHRGAERSPASLERRTGLKTTVRILTGLAAVGLGLLMTAPWAVGQGLTDFGTTQPAQDADALRRQSDDLLKRAKQAIAERNYQGAELLIRQAEALGVSYPPLHLGDTPSKVRRSLEAARSAAGAPAPGQTPFDARGLSADDPKSLAKTYLRNGRLALAKGDVQDAANWYRAAVGVSAVFSPDEDSPAKLADDLRRMGYDPTVGNQAGSANGAPITPLPPVGQMTSMTPPGITPESKSPTQKQSDQWLLEARRALALGDIKTAQRHVEQVRSLGLTYGRFEDSPERIETLIRTYQDLMAQKAERGQSEGWRRLYAKLLLEQADGLLRWGDLNEAERLAQHAVQQGVSFSPFELRPETILDRVAEERRRRSPVSVPEAAANAPGYALAAKQRAADLLHRARAALQAGDWSTAETYAMQAASFQLPESAFGPGEDSPARMLAAVQQAKSSAGVVPAAAQGVVPASGNYGTPNVAAAAVYNPAADATRNVAASAVQPGLPAGPFQAEAAVPGRGMMLVRQAEEALRRNDVATAMEYFRQSTAYFAEMDPVTVQRVQDILQQSAARTSYQTVPPGSEISMQQQMIVRQLSAELAQKESQALSLLDGDPARSRQILEGMRGKIETASVDSAARDQLLRRLDARLAEIDRYVEQNKPILDRRQRNAEVETSVTQTRSGTFDKQGKLAEMVQEYNQLISQQRFAEAEVVAKRAVELDPENPVTQQLVLNARFIRQYSENMALKDQKEQAFLATLASVDRSSVPFDDSNPFLLPDAREWKQLTDRRAKMAEIRRQRSERELEIERKLSTPVMMQFESAPLSRVIDFLAKLTDVNVHIDPNGLATEGVSTDTPVTINLSQEVSLKSALNLILQPLHLSYVIQDDVLKITSEQMTRGVVYTRAYDVADLVSPIPNFIQSGMPLDAAYANAMRQAGVASAGTTPNTVLASRGGERVSAVINPAILAQMSQSTANALPGGANVPFGAGAGGMGGAALADFQSLIDLIQTTVNPTSWDAQGGPGSISPFPTNLSLVISNTQEVHEQIADLLEQLRRMQDLQVTVEVRFITLNDNFFERIGVDFDFDINDKIDGRRGVTFGQVVTPADPANDEQEVRDLSDKDSSRGVTVGLSAPVGLGAPASFSADLDIPFRQGSFALATPQFGGYDGTAGAQLGFAILSEIEAFFFIEAAQGDRRSNVLQAPKVTLFNGQYASISDQSTSPFVMGIIPVVGDFAAAQQPVVVMVSEGTFLTVQAVVSQDRRFVRMTVIPYFARIQEVNQFTFTGSETTTETTSAEGNQTEPNDNTKNSRNRTTTRQGSTVQLPTVASVSVNTTVSVPDGGTVLLGGIKRLSEGRNEFGVPMLSKIPYLNRLFKNAGVGRETQSLMMMVTPRIIIPEEEEEKLGITTP